MGIHASTVNASPNAELTAVLARTQCILLDFDGPICDVFTGTASTIAKDLYSQVEQLGGQVASGAKQSDDPFDALRLAATISNELAEQIEAALTKAELKAIKIATPTPHTNKVIELAQSQNISIGVVSNNSHAAVSAYLSRQKITVDAVAARENPDPALLKPNPMLVIAALHALNAQPGNVTLIGDSVTDINAAKAARTNSIGYVNKPHEEAEFTQVGADAIVQDMQEIAAELARV